MTQQHVKHLFAAELQFRLASAVQLATTRKTQPIDLPTAWIHGSHRVDHAEIALRPDQAEFAAWTLHRSATFLMAVAIKDAIQAVTKSPHESGDVDIANSYQIARQIRNAFAHSPFAPVWKIDKSVSNKIFAVPDIIKLDTTDLDGRSFDWRHYGGPLALFKLCRFVRVKILKDPNTGRNDAPPSDTVIYQMGDLIVEEISKIPDNAVVIEPLTDGSIPLGHGYSLAPKKNA